MSGKRIEWLDIAKGVGIILVVAGHCFSLSGTFAQLIFVFHMPLFFMLSGYVFNDRDSFIHCLVKKAKGLLLPFAGFYLLGLAVTLLVPQWREGLTVEGIKSDLFLGNPDSVHNSSIWFLVCLFIVCLAFWWVRRLPLPLQIVCLLASYAIGIWYSRNIFPVFGYGRMPLDIDCALIAVVFFACGFYLRRYCVVERIPNRRAFKATAAAACAALTLGAYALNGSVNLHGLSFGNPIVYLMGGICGSLCVLLVSMLVEDAACGAAAAVKGVLVWYGRHSLGMLGCQSLLIRLYILAMAAWRSTSLVLYQFPLKHAVACFALVGLAACPLLCWLGDGAMWWTARAKREIAGERQS